MKLLIVGGTGVLSLAVAKEAIAQNISVTMINRGNRIGRIPPEARLIKADKRDHSLIASLIDGEEFDAIIDFLCVSNEDTRKSILFYSKYTTQYCFISSAAVIDTTIIGPYNEESKKPQKLWDYSVQKFESEKDVIHLAFQLGINYTIIRPCITYDDTRIPYGIAPRYEYHWTLIARILNNKPIITWNNVKNRCNMMRVEDFAVGVVGLVGNHKAYNEIFNVCGDEYPSFMTVLDSISRVIKHSVLTIDISSRFYAKEVPSRRGEILGGRSLDSINSNLKIKSAVPSFKQTFFLSEGVAKTIDAYKRSAYQKGIDWSFDAECDRVISKWCEINKINPDQYNLHFIDYLRNATPHDKKEYYIERNRKRFDIRLFLFSSYMFTKISHIPSKVFSFFKQSTHY